MVQAFTHSPAVVEADKGGKFQLLNGSVTGEFLELVSSLVMTSRLYVIWKLDSVFPLDNDLFAHMISPSV